MGEVVTLERQGRVAILRINRPEALNALNSQVMAEMVEKATALDADRDVGCMVITGSDKAFAAGADIKEFADYDGAQGRQLAERGQRTLFDAIFLCLRDHPLGHRLRQPQRREHILFHQRLDRFIRRVQRVG